MTSPWDVVDQKPVSLERLWFFDLILPFLSRNPSCGIDHLNQCLPFCSSLIRTLELVRSWPIFWSIAISHPLTTFERKSADSFVDGKLVGDPLLGWKFIFRMPIAGRTLEGPRGLTGIIIVGG